MLLRGITENDRVVWHIFRHNRTGANQRMFANGIATNDGGIGSDTSSPLDECGYVILAPIPRECGTRREDVGEDNRRPAKNVIF
jgi:hypothetical protein